MPAIGELVPEQVRLPKPPRIGFPEMTFASRKVVTYHSERFNPNPAVQTAKYAKYAEGEARDAALAALTKRLRGVIAELSQLISDTDGRLLDMGLNMPGAAELPEVVDGVVVEPSSTGHLRVRWNTSARAERYRIFKQVVGTNPVSFRARR